MKIITNRFTSDPKIVIQGNECIVLFLTRYFMSWTHNFAKINYVSLISPLSPGTIFSDIALWRHHSWLSGVPDYFGRNKISSGGDLSHYSSASLY